MSGCRQASRLVPGRWTPPPPRDADGPRSGSRPPPSRYSRRGLDGAPCAAGLRRRSRQRYHGATDRPVSPSRSPHGLGLLILSMRAGIIDRDRSHRENSVAAESNGLLIRPCTWKRVSGRLFSSAIRSHCHRLLLQVFDFAEFSSTNRCPSVGGGANAADAASGL